jgi:hypothetical protein
MYEEGREWRGRRSRSRNEMSKRSWGNGKYGRSSLLDELLWLCKDVVESPSTAGGLAVLEVEDVADFVAGAEDETDVVDGVGGRDAEADSGGDERGGRVAWGEGETEELERKEDESAPKKQQKREGTKTATEKTKSLARKKYLPTTTVTIGVWSGPPNRSIIILENNGIFAGLNVNIGTIGESRCP